MPPENEQLSEEKPASSATDKPETEGTETPKEGADGEDKSDDWRTVLKSDDAKKFAETSPDVEHLVGRALDMRRQLATAIIPPGKDAKPEELTAYQKKIGVPVKSDGYEISRPEHLDEEGFKSEPVQKILSLFKERAHAVNAPKDVFESLVGTYWEVESALKEAQATEDQQYADEGEAELRKLWPGKEYDENKDYMYRAAARIFGTNLDEVKNLEGKDGRFFLDNPVILRGLAAVGREMASGGLVPPLSESQRVASDDQLKDVRKKIAESQSKGDTKEANRLYQVEQDLIAKTSGSGPIVGDSGRVA